MGQFWSNEMSSSVDDTSNKKSVENWPWAWAIIDTEQLDWKSAKSSEEIMEMSRSHQQLPVQVSDYLFLSDARKAHDLERLDELKITHVLNVAGRPAKGPASKYTAKGIQVLNIDADDEEGYPMLAKHLAEARAFIGQARSSGGRCVVHCVAGMNRSGVIVAAEKMLSERVPVLDVVAHCRSARGNSFLCNESFAAELVALARLNGLLGPAPGAPGSRVAAQPVPMSAFARPESTAVGENSTRKFRAKEVRGLF
mmetsp:Transcript_83098/g.161750  ORF Transcript_83098/g.161750 Transcript_83098/m.161750 type:complete len:254 (+) Transcript_83098:61-822(+)|eukprot:CAMPEP_0171649434 /NCGR_PEP_ID=MMETSP0990-20121206/36797_1 /TAXON_ID=483369 /ORGANISM="non described non described, Strain CCMP2098" /LENGTH=253 /DNA_ID=CAMNT_0012227343 /DNA_START=133 /DNA_END=894 /DNA_ORIENTATION=+